MKMTFDSAEFVRHMEASRAAVDSMSRSFKWMMDCPRELRVPQDAGPGPHGWDGDQA